MRRTIWLCGAIAGLLSQVVALETVTPPEMEAPIRRAVVFKNGLAFTFREATFTAKGDRVVLKNAPNAILGAIWGYTTDPKVRIVSMNALERKETHTVQNLAELLMLNEGAEVEVTLNALYDKSPPGSYSSWNTPRVIPTEERTYRGKLVVMKPVLNPNTVQRNPYRPRRYSSWYESYPDTLRDETSQLAQLASFAVESDDGTIAVFHPEEVAHVRFLEKQYKREREITIPQNDLELVLSGVRQGQKVTIGIVSIERGLTWIPTYELLLDTPREGKATLNLRGTLVNALDTLTDAEVFLAVGTPHFLFRGVGDPLTLNETYWQLLTMFERDARHYTPDYFYYGRFGGFGGFGGSGAAPSAPAPSPVPSGMGFATIQQSDTLYDWFNIFSPEEGMGVLHLFRLPKITLEERKVASFSLETFTVSYETVYLYTKAAEIPESWRWRYSRSRELETINQLNQQYTIPMLVNRIWKAARLTNRTPIPLPSGTVLIRSGSDVVGQDTLAFTPPGESTEIRLQPTESIHSFEWSVLVDVNEGELAKQFHLVEDSSEAGKGQRGFGYSGYRTVRADAVRILFTNALETPVKLIVRLEVHGKLIRKPEGAIVRTVQSGITRNPLSFVSLELTLPPGETPINYTYLTAERY